MKSPLKPLLLLLLSTIPSFSEPPAKELTPQPPFVAPVPENASWTLILRAPDEIKDPQKNRPIPKGLLGLTISQVNTAKTGKLKYDNVTFADGKSSEYWYLDNSIFLTQQGGKAGATQITGDWNLNSPTIPSGFAGTQWIQLKNYDRVVMFNKQSCFHYQLRVDGDITTEAWIDVKTNLPAGYRVDGNYYVYEFGAPPSSALSLPPLLQETLDSFKKDLEYKKQLEKDLQ